MRKKEIDPKRLWKRLFSSQDEVKYDFLTDEEFERLIKNLKLLNTHGLEWDVNYQTKKVIIWKATEDHLMTLNFLLLLGNLNLEALKIYGTRNSDKNNSKDKR